MVVLPRNALAGSDDVPDSPFQSGPYPHGDPGCKVKITGGVKDSVIKAAKIVSKSVPSDGIVAAVTVHNPLFDDLMIFTVLCPFCTSMTVAGPSRQALW